MRIDLLLRVGLVGEVGVVGITVIIAAISHGYVITLILLFRKVNNAKLSNELKWMLMCWRRVPAWRRAVADPKG